MSLVNQARENILWHHVIYQAANWVRARRRSFGSPIFWCERFMRASPPVHLSYSGRRLQHLLVRTKIARSGEGCMPVHRGRPLHSTSRSKRLLNLQSPSGFQRLTSHDYVRSQVRKARLFEGPRRRHVPRCVRPPLAKANNQGPLLM